MQRGMLMSVEASGGALRTSGQRGPARPGSDEAGWRASRPTELQVKHPIRPPSHPRAHAATASESFVLVLDVCGRGVGVMRQPAPTWSDRRRSLLPAIIHHAPESRRHPRSTLKIRRFPPPQSQPQPNIGLLTVPHLPTHLYPDQLFTSVSPLPALRKSSK